MNRSSSNQNTDAMTSVAFANAVLTKDSSDKLMKTKTNN